MTVVSVRRPYGAASVLFSTALVSFAASFRDLLYQHEVMTLAGAGVTLLILGRYIAQLSLLSRDLRGTELTSAVWGTHGSLQSIRREIVTARQCSRAGASS